MRILLVCALLHVCFGSALIPQPDSAGSFGDNAHEGHNNPSDKGEALDCDLCLRTGAPCSINCISNGTVLNPKDSDIVSPTPGLPNAEEELNDVFTTLNPGDLRPKRTPGALGEFNTKFVDVNCETCHRNGVRCPFACKPRAPGVDSGGRGGLLLPQTPTPSVTPFVVASTMTPALPSNSQLITPRPSPKNRRHQQITDCQRCRNAGTRCPTTCARKPSPTPSSVPLLSPVPADESPLTCEECRRIGGNCPDSCATLPKNSGGSSPVSCTECNRRGLRCPSACEILPSVTPKKPEPQADPQSEFSCYLCRQTGERCPLGCQDKRPNIQPSSSPSGQFIQPPLAECERCALENTRCPSRCEELFDIVTPANCSECKRLGVRCPTQCKVLPSRLPVVPEPSPLNLTKTICDNCKRERTLCPSFCDSTPKNVESQQSTIPVPSVLNGTVGCNPCKVGQICAITCAEYLNLNQTGQTEAPSDCSSCQRRGTKCPSSCMHDRPITHVSCSECKHKGVLCPSKCEPLSVATPTPSQIISVESTCDSCVREGLTCPEHCGFSDLAEKPQSQKSCDSCRRTGLSCPSYCTESRCWLCLGLGAPCGASCNASNAFFDADWATELSSSCWMCDEYPALCPEFCER